MDIPKYSFETLSYSTITEYRLPIVKGEPKADTSLRDDECIPLKENIKKYVEREILAHEIFTPKNKPNFWLNRVRSFLVKGTLVKKREKILISAILS